MIEFPIDKNSAVGFKVSLSTKENNCHLNGKSKTEFCFY